MSPKSAPVVVDMFCGSGGKWVCNGEKHKRARSAKTGYSDEQETKNRKWE